MSFRAIVLLVGLVVAPTMAGAEIEVVGPVPVGSYGTLFGLSLEIESLGATSVEAVCRDGAGNALSTLPATAITPNTVVTLPIPRTVVGLGMRVTCQTTGSGGSDGEIQTTLNVTFSSGDPWETVEGTSPLPVPGPEGPPGAQGFQGKLGPQGDQGPQGKIGPQGDQGAQGKIGPQGDQGPQGKLGPQGDQGAQGKLGPQGDQGPQGKLGPQGDQGAQGKLGPQGDQGPQGKIGPQGDQGPQGKIGPQGDQGPQGKIGPQGDQGPQGKIGPQGDQGVQGKVGPQGDPGLSCWDLDGDSLCDAGEDVDNSGTCDAADCQGEPGAPGPAGELPAGMVAFFDAASCPTGWVELTAARGRVLVGLPSGGTLGGTAGAGLGDLETPQHGHAHGGLNTQTVGAHAHGVDAIGPFQSGLAGEHLHYTTTGPPDNNVTDGSHLGNTHVADDSHRHVTVPGPDAVAVFNSDYELEHAHSVSVPGHSTQSTGLHSHAVTGSIGNSSAGLPYLQLLACRKS